MDNVDTITSMDLLDQISATPNRTQRKEEKEWKGLMTWEKIRRGADLIDHQRILRKNESLLLRILNVFTKGLTKVEEEV